jgi:prepilin-type N-terminal cleavage/methylation domain-containing protein
MRAFTLIELLTVIAIIAVLAAILIPTVSSVRVSANKTKTKVQFSQWAGAIEAFRSEYGYAPQVTTDNLLNAAAFFAAITGRNYRGESLAGALLNGNMKAISFCPIADSEQVKDTSGVGRDELCDAFGNSEIVVLIDADGNGVIAGPELARRAVRAGNSVVGFGASLEPATERFPASGLRARAVFYSAGAGGTADDIVYSWR